MEDLLVEALIAVCLLVAAVIVALIAKALISRSQGASADGGEVLAVSEGSSDAAPAASGGEPEPKMPPKEESEPQRLARTEKELAERESRAKAEKIRELAEREKVLRKREVEVAAEPPKQQEPVDDLLEERKRMQEMIKRAEERYAAGELEEKNFKRIASDYQQQILDLDIKLKKRH